MTETKMTKSKRRSFMESFLTFALILAAYFGLQFYILPKLGVPT